MHNFTHKRITHGIVVAVVVVVDIDGAKFSSTARQIP